MPNLDNITSLINASMQAGNFSSRRFQAAKFFPIADPIKTTGEEKERTEPYIISNEGEGESVVYDDTQALQIYHIVDSLEYSIANPDDYGTPGTIMQETANMRMIFIGSRRRIKVRTEDIIAASAMDFPKEFAPSQVSALSMNSCIIEMQDVESDPYKVWEDQFIGTEYSLGTDTTAFWIRYKIIDTYNKSCFKLCN